MGDTSSVRVVVAWETPTGSLDDQFLGNPRKGTNGKVLGSKYKIEVLRIWPRAEQVDEIGCLRPFFPRPPGPGNGGGRDDWGRFTDPHFYGPVLQGHGWAGPDVYFYQLLPPICILRLLLPSTDSPPPSVAPPSPILAIPWYEDDSP